LVDDNIVYEPFGDELGKIKQRYSANSPGFIQQIQEKYDRHVTRYPTSSEIDLANLQAAHITVQR
jgi:hypothetical protein